MTTKASPKFETVPKEVVAVFGPDGAFLWFSDPKHYASRFNSYYQYAIFNLGEPKCEEPVSSVDTKDLIIQRALISR